MIYLFWCSKGGILMEYLFDDLKGLLISAKKECNKRLKSLDDMVNNIISWDYTETSTIEKIFDELLGIGMFCDVLIQLLMFIKPFGVL